MDFQSKIAYRVVVNKQKQLLAIIKQLNITSVISKVELKFKLVKVWSSLKSQQVFDNLFWSAFQRSAQPLLLVQNTYYKLFCEDWQQYYNCQKEFCDLDFISLSIKLIEVDCFCTLVPCTFSDNLNSQVDLKGLSGLEV